MFKSLAITGALALSALAGQALAADPVPAHAVSTAGVDFQNPAAVKALYQRLYQAANSVCRDAGAQSLAVPAQQSCVHQAMNDAIAHADRPLLTAMWSQHDGVQTAYATR